MSEEHEDRFCRHWTDDCEKVCKCGHACTLHEFDVGQSGGTVCEECDCSRWREARFSVHRIGKLLRNTRLLGIHWSPADQDRRWETVNRLRIGLWFTVIEILWDRR